MPEITEEQREVLKKMCDMSEGVIDVLTLRSLMETLEAAEAERDDAQRTIMQLQHELALALPSPLVQGCILKGAQMLDNAGMSAEAESIQNWLTAAKSIGPEGFLNELILLCDRHNVRSLRGGYVVRTHLPHRWEAGHWQVDFEEEEDAHEPR